MAENKNIIDEVNARLRDAINYLIYQGIVSNDKELAKQISANRTYLSQILNGKVRATDKFIMKFCKVYSNINFDWILTGNGTMLRSETTQTDECTAVKSSDNLTAALQTINTLVSQMAEKDRVMADIISEKDRQIGQLIDMMSEKKTAVRKDVSAAAADV